MGTNILEETERKRQQREFKTNAQRLLTEEDRDYLHSILKEFNAYRSVDKLILALKSCLDTPEKLDLLKDIRTLIPQQLLSRFDSLAPYRKMAHPTITREMDIAKTSNNNQSNGNLANGMETSSEDSKTSFRIVSLNKADATPSGTMGFSIRGGREMNMGIYVCKVDDNSLAQKQGLREGDQIIEVNGVSFEHIANSSAVNFLSSLNKIKFVVKSTGKRFSLDKSSTVMDNSITTWVDKDGKPLTYGNADDLNSSTKSDSLTNGLTLQHNHWHLSDADERRINFTVEFTPSGFIGFNIRGGAEYGLGIYVSGVDIGSVVEESGIQVGDQILDVNGRNFESIKHQDAVDFIKAQKHIMMTVKAVGKLPEAKHFFSELSWIHPDGSITRESKYHGAQSISPPISPRLDMSDTAVQFPDLSSNGLQTSDPFPRPPSIDNATQTVDLEPEPPVEVMVSPMTSTPNHSPLKEPDIEMVVMSSDDNVDAKPDMQDIQSDNGKGYDTKSVESRTSSTSSGAEKKLEATKRSSLDSLGDPEYAEVIPKSYEDRGSGAKKKRSKSFLSKQGDKIRAKLSFRKKAKPKVDDRRGQEPDEMRAYIANKAKKTLSVDEFNAFLRIMKDYENDGNCDTMTKRMIEILDQPNKAILLRDIRSIVHPHDLGRFDTIVRDKEVEILEWINTTNPSASSLLEGGDSKPQRRQRIEPVIDSKGNFSLRTESDAATLKKHREKLVKQKGQIFAQKSSLLDREHRRASTAPAPPPGFAQASLPIQAVTPLPYNSPALNTIPDVEPSPSITITEPVQQTPTTSTTAETFKPKPQPPPPYKPPVVPTLLVPSIQVNDSPEIVIEPQTQKLNEEPPQLFGGSFLAVPDRVAAEYKDEEDVQSSDFITPVNTGITAMESSSAGGDPFAPQMLTVNLSKQRTSMGISISGGKGSRSQPEIRVEKVFPGGAAYDNGMLQSGYEIVSIDGLSLQGVSHAEAVDIIRKAYNDKNKSVMEIVVIP